MATAPTHFYSLAMSKSVRVRAIKVALIVGTALAFINHGDKMVAMSLDGEHIMKIILSYLVPYGVSTWSAVNVIRENAANKASKIV